MAWEQTFLTEHDGQKADFVQGCRTPPKGKYVPTTCGCRLHQPQSHNPQMATGRAGGNQAVQMKNRPRPWKSITRVAPKNRAYSCGFGNKQRRRNVRPTRALMKTA